MAPSPQPHPTSASVTLGLGTPPKAGKVFTCASCGRLTVTAVQGIFYNPPSDHPAASALQPAEPQPGADDEQEPQKTPHGNTEEAATTDSNLTPRREKRRSTRPRASPRGEDFQWHQRGPHSAIDTPVHGNQIARGPSRPRPHRAIWYSSYAYHRPYPGDRSVLLPQQVAGGSTD